MPETDIEKMRRTVAEHDAKVQKDRADKAAKLVAPTREFAESPELAELVAKARALSESLTGQPQLRSILDGMIQNAGLLLQFCQMAEDAEIKRLESEGS